MLQNSHFSFFSKKVELFLCVLSDLLNKLLRTRSHRGSPMKYSKQWDQPPTPHPASPRPQPASPVTPAGKPVSTELRITAHFPAGHDLQTWFNKSSFGVRRGLMVQGFSPTVGDENILKLLVVMAAQLCDYTKKTTELYFKWVNSLVCELYFNETHVTLKSYHSRQPQNVSGLYYIILTVEG